MKRLLTIILLSAALLGASAGNPARLFDEFKHADNAEYVKVPRFLLWIAKAAGSFEGVPLAGKISGIKVLTLEGASAQSNARFDSRLKEETADYDELINVKDDDSRVRIFSRADGEKFRNLYILAIDNSECAFIELSGKFTVDDLRKIAEER